MIEALGYVAFNEPNTADPIVVDFPESCVASPFWPEPMGVGTQLRIEVRV